MVDPKRKSREESRAETRRRLLDSAREVFAEKGFNGASVEEIADRAGYSRGAFYSNFQGKDELFLTLLDERDRRQFSEVAAMMQDARRPGDFLDAMRDRIRNREERRAWFMLSLEFVLYAMRNVEVLPKLAERHQTETQAYAWAVQVQHEALGIPLPAPPEQLGMMIRAMERGIMIHEFLTPDSVPGQDFVDALSLLVRATAALAAQGGPTPARRGRSANRGRRPAPP